jgi:hypothetical protein
LPNLSSASAAIFSIVGTLPLRTGSKRLPGVMIGWHQLPAL